MKQTDIGHDEICAAVLSMRGSIRAVAAFSAAANLLMLAPSLYMLQVYDRALASGNLFTLGMLTVMVIGLLALMGALEYARSRVIIHAGSRIDDLLARRVHQSAFERGLAGGQSNAAQATRDLDAIRQFLTGNAVFAFFDAPWTPLFLIVMFLFHPLIGALALAGIIILAALAWLNDRLSHDLLKQAGALSVQAMQSVEMQLRNSDSIESMGMLARLYRLWRGPHRGYVRRQALASERSALISAISRTFRLALQSLVLGLGAWLVIDGRMSAGMMIAGSILMGRVLTPVDQMIAAWRQWASTRLSWERLRALLSVHPARPDRLPLPAPTGNLRVEGVSATPPGVPNATPTVLGVTFALEKGDMLGIIGPSGSGKSTLGRLIAGVWKTRAGTVRLDGADILHWDRERLGPHVGYLPQEVELFAGTVAENISRFADTDADPVKITDAAVVAGAHDMILTLPNGYDTRLGPGGQGLSGGQRQRIALVRALYGNPCLVILDEPNASLDEAGEKALVEALTRLREKRVTTILITHRPKVLEVTTKLLVLGGGRAHAFGPTAEVLTRMRGGAASKSAPPQGGQVVSMPGTIGSAALNADGAAGAAFDGKPSGV
ncbi:type I secretion system permease/ATPase [Novosphingobium sp. M1R2S20]|uniref:Type I secretion system permease/ATPase n=1 Tax=Novosphingobium rhizovicinum TaxID=3228928 RepID=A0ABV3R967_9SPHN